MVCFVYKKIGKNPQIFGILEISKSTFKKMVFRIKDPNTFGNMISPTNVPLYWKNGSDVICLIQFAAWSTICWILKSFNYRQESSNLLNNCIICPFFALRKEIEACSTKKSNLLARLHGFCQVEQKSQKRSLRLFYYLLGGFPMEIKTKIRYLIIFLPYDNIKIIRYILSWF